MEQADELCRNEQLLGLAAAPLVREFRLWFASEFIRQIAGGAFTPRKW